MTTLTRWQASTGPNEPRGMATFSACGKTLQVRLESFSDARALDELIDLVALRGRRATRVACAIYIRAAAAQMEGAG